MHLKKALPWILAGMITVSAQGLGITAADAEPAQVPHQMHQDMTKDGHQMMDPKMMQEMMKDPAMQKKCVDMMQQPAMQSMMKAMLQKPEMQAIMKKMMQKDGHFHKMMVDLVNSVDMDDTHKHGTATRHPETMEH